MSRIGNPIAFAALLAFAGPAPAQDRRPSVDDIPPVERQTRDFYHAIADGPRGVEAAWTVEPTATVPVIGELTLTLTVRHAANPHELAKPDLRTLDEFTARFQVLDRTDPPVAPDAAEARFTYTLRPRSADVKEVPPLRYVYFRRIGRDWKPFTTYATSVPITVIPTTAPPSPAAPPVPLDAPEEFFALAEERPAATPGRYGWLLPVAAVPFLVAGWVVLWRWLFPDAVRLARLRRNRAARRALDRLKAARTSADPAAAAAAAFRDYLTARYGMLPAAQTPAEVSAALAAVEFPADRTADAEAFLRACDAARFRPTPDNGLSLIPQAEALVTVWEEAGR
jgi:hypothetical protein